MEKITATFDGDSKRYHRFTIDAGQDIVGNVYISKDDKVPDEVTITLRTKKVDGGEEDDEETK